MFMSFSLSDTETRYTTTERECLAVLRCLEEVRHLVVGVKWPIMLYTDHSALTSILHKGDAKGRIAAWQYRLSEYDFTITHVPGRKMSVADGLSRIKDSPHAFDRGADGDEFPLQLFPV